jgi:hypothetical protein
MATKGRRAVRKPDVPDYLKSWPGLFMRQGDRIVEALPDDIDVAKGYPTFPGKGRIKRGRRITVMSRQTEYRVGEEVRVIHVLEVLEPGQEILAMGPKPVSGEYVDGRALTPEASGEGGAYDGRVLQSPGVDYNYDITSYTFDTPGRHTIQWRMGELRSNTLDLKVVP